MTKNFAAGWNENVSMQETQNSKAICHKFTPSQLFLGLNFQNVHVVLATCLKLRRNHDLYSTKRTSIFKCSKWKCKNLVIKWGTRNDEIEQNEKYMMKTFDPPGLLQAPPFCFNPCFEMTIVLKCLNVFPQNTFFRLPMN